MLNLYADGGCIGRNDAGGGSKIGGTWAWRLVRPGDGVMAASGGARVLLEQIQNWPDAPPSVQPWTATSRVSNNHMELQAVIEGMRRVFYWFAVLNNPVEPVHIYSDSGVTLGRLFHNWGWKNIPEEMKGQALLLVKQLPIEGHTLLAGHPNKKDLARGYKVKVSSKGVERQVPVSEHNEWCDHECRRQGNIAMKYMRTGERWSGADLGPKVMA